MFSLDFKLCIELSKKYFHFSIFLFINKKVEITQNLWSMFFKDKKEKYTLLINILELFLALCFSWLLIFYDRSCPNYFHEENWDLITCDEIMTIAKVVHSTRLHCFVIIIKYSRKMPLGQAIFIWPHVQLSLLPSFDTWYYLMV